MENLPVLAEISIALAGFSSVIVIFRRTGADGAWKPEDVFRLRIMLQYGLAAAGFAILPEVGLGMGMPLELLWPTMSGLLAIYLTADLLHQQKAARALPSGSLNPALAVLVVSLNTIVFVIQLLNVIGLRPSQGSGPYLLGVTWLTVSAGIMFYRLITAPIAPPR